jgi:uncharacterized protein
MGAPPLQWLGPSGERCAAWHHRAAGVPAEDGRPCVVLAHGFTMTADARLHAYAERFAAAGLDALVFDYRCCGASEGTPRQWLDVGRQQQDWRAAIAHARGLPGVDPERIALWGTSFSGGHVAAVAGETPGIAAVVSQVPFSGFGGERPPAAPPRRVGHQVRMLGAALRDLAAARAGRPPVYVPVVAEPPAFAAGNRPGDVAELAVLTDGASTWENRFTPRVVLQMARYRPFGRAGEIRCPWLLQVCDPDTITPADAAVRRAAPAADLTVERHPYGHYEVYTGEAFERLVAAQVAFLRAALLS